jgi:hypothetical protein
LGSIPMDQVCLFFLNRNWIFADFSYLEYL